MSTALQTAPDAPSTPMLIGVRTPAGTSTTPASVTVADRFYRLTVAQYHAMAEAGILGAEDRIELLEGLLVTKMTKNDPQMLATELAQEAFTLALPAGWYVSMQNPITIVEADSEPEPDAKVVRGLRRDYKGRRIFPADVSLVLEVSDSTVREDQSTKKALYALASIPSYWIVNLVANRLEVYTDPTGPDPSPDYRRRSDHGPDDLVPLVLDGREVARIAVRDLMP